MGSSHYERYKETIRAYQKAHQEQINEYYRLKRAERKRQKQQEYDEEVIKRYLESQKSNMRPL